MKFPFQSAEQKYEILHKLGEGGMGAVFKVRHRLLDELRVVKIVHAVHAGKVQAQRRFEREAKAATALRHPHIAHIYDYVVEQGGAYMVMELIDGLTFKQWMQAVGRLPLNLALELAYQSLDALGYLHRRGFLHRDVAPDNLMLCRRPDGGPLVKLIDLGLAKGASDSFDLTASNMFVGKVRYASPEVFKRPAAGPSALSDLYSFGIVFYEMLTGVCPIPGESFEEVMASHLMRPALSFEETDPDGHVPPAIRMLVWSILSKDPAQRPASAEAIRQALDAYRGDPLDEFTALWSQHGHLTRDSDEVLPTLTSPTEGQLDRQENLADGRGDRGPSGGEIPTVLARDSDLHLVEPTMASWTARWTRSRTLIGLLLGAFVLALFGAWGLSTMRSEAPVEMAAAPTPRPVGRLLVEASPWAEIQAVRRASDGQRLPFEEALHTPTELVLAPGDYVLDLVHPEVEGLRSVSVRVPVAGTVRVHEELISPSIDDYLQRQGLRNVVEQAGQGL